MIESAAGTLLGLRSFVLSGVPGLPRTPAELFNNIYVVFVLLGTLVGVVVVAYMLKNAWVYRDGTGNGEKADVKRPELGELPSGSGGGRKLFLSFGISAVIVLSLIVWTYSALLYVEDTPQEPDLEVDVVGEQFAWTFQYENGAETINEFRVPNGSLVKINVQSADVFHNFGIPKFKVKADAMPGHTTSSWFVPDELGTTMAHCYELCGAGHSGMDAEVIVMEQGEFDDWYESAGTDEGGNTTDGGSDDGEAAEGGAGGGDGAHAIAAASAGGSS